MPVVEGKLPEWLIYVACYIWCYMYCGYFATAFLLLTFENFHQVYSSMYYIGHIVLFATIAVTHALLPKRESQKETVKPESKGKQD